MVIGQEAKLKLLPKEQYKIQLTKDGKHIAASIYEHPEGVRYWFKYDFSDLPNDFISIEDLERFGITGLGDE